jgi:hypothetical protein
MAKGLCQKCGEKWHKGHTCAAVVQLNVLQEMWDLFEQNLESDRMVRLLMNLMLLSQLVLPLHAAYESHAPAPLHAAHAHAPESSCLCLPIQH